MTAPSPWCGSPRYAAHPVVTVSDKRVRFWDGEDSKEASGGDDWVTDADVSADGELIVSPSVDGTARVWSTRYGAPIAVLRGHHDAVNRAFFVSQDQIVTASADGTLRVWRLRRPELLAARRGWMLDAEIDHSGSRVLVCGEVDGCEIVAARDVADRSEGSKGLDKVGSDPVGTASWSWDDALVLGHRQDQGVSGMFRPTVWETGTGRDVTPEWLGRYWMATFSPGTPELVTTTLQGQVSGWNIGALKEENPRPEWTIEIKEPLSLAVMSPNGRWIAVPEGDSIALFSLAGGRPSDEPRLLIGHEGNVESVAFSADSRRLVSASSDRTARVWPVELSTASAEGPLVLGAGAKLYGAAFSSDGRQVVAGGTDNIIRVWDTGDGRELGALHWHTEAVNSVQFTPDGRILSASDDGTVKLGRCEACSQTIAELSARVASEALLSPGESADTKSQRQPEAK